MADLAQVPMPTRRQRWTARGSLLALVAAVLVLAFAPGVRGITLLAIVVAHVVVIVLGLWLFVAHRGVVRIAGAVLAVVVAVSLPVIEIANHLLWVVLLTAGLLALSYLAARASAGEVVVPTPPPQRTAGRAQRPFFIMNPRSGGGKVERFALAQKARALGGQVALLEGPGSVDVAELARRAVADGADLLGVAGGDGTQALVAAVAAEHDVPLLVIPAGTRNHFALDLGLDRADPAASLDALDDGVDLQVDLGDVDGRPFVNNVSFGAYASAVARPDYRADKVRVTLDVLPDLLSGHEGPRLTVRAGDVVVTDPTAALVSNNPYGTGDVAGLGRRARLDGGRLGLVAVRTHSALQAVGVLAGRRSRELSVLTAPTVVVESAADTVPAGLDGETVQLPAPVHCRVRPGALRVRVPRTRPGVPPSREKVPLPRLLGIAFPGRPRDARAPAPAVP